eukprot:507029-Prorocentrum_minimum.AAC.4
MGIREKLARIFCNVPLRTDTPEPSEASRSESVTAPCPSVGIPQLARQAENRELTSQSSFSSSDNDSVQTTRRNKHGSDECLFRLSLEKTCEEISTARAASLESEVEPEDANCSRASLDGPDVGSLEGLRSRSHSRSHPKISNDGQREPFQADLLSSRPMHRRSTRVWHTSAGVTSRCAI